MISSHSAKNGFYGPIVPIVLTGGVCGGKTEILNSVKLALNLSGYVSVSTSECATLMFGNNTAPNWYGVVGFHVGIAEMQIAQENVMRRRLLDYQRRNRRRMLPQTPCVMICDRGLFDIGAYFPLHHSKRLVRIILERQGLSVKAAMDRYSGVIHMVTAADGAEEFYTTKNNTARKETPEQARALDKRTIQAWNGHPDHVIVKNLDSEGNRIDFKKKTQIVIDHVFRIIDKAREAYSPQTRVDAA